LNRFQAPVLDQPKLGI